MNKIQLLQGVIAGLGNIFVDVELYHIKPTQTIKALVISPLFIHAGEQEMNIKKGTEVMLLGWGVDGLNNFLVLGSTANGIEVGGLGITKIENLKEVKIIAPKVFIGNNTGNRDNIKGDEVQGDELYAWVKNLKTKSDKTLLETHTMKIKNEASFEIVSLISDLMANVIKLEAMHGLVDTIPLKAKLETFK